MPIAVEVTSPAKFAQWVGQNGGHMPGAKAAGSAAAGQPSAARQPATRRRRRPPPGTAATNPAPAPNSPNVANRTNQ